MEAASSAYLRRSARRSWKPAARGSTPRKTFCATVSDGTIASSWAIRITPLAIASLGEWNLTGSPSSSSSPPSALCAPAMILPRVDLPAPFSPTRAWIEPLAMVRLTPSRACVPPKDLETSFSSTCAPWRAGSVSGTLSPSTHR